MTPGDAALRYAGILGWPVFPRRGRVPLTEHGWKDASRDPDTIIGWWERWPRALIATPTGAISGVIVLDIDRKNGVDGYETLERIGRSQLPETPMAQTPSGGVHVYFGVNPQVRIGFSIGSKDRGLGPGLDVLGEGTSVALPTPGWDYRWDPYLHPGNMPLHVAPGWFAVRRNSNGNGSAQAVEPTMLLAEACNRIRDAGPGSRHGTVVREAFIVGCIVARGRLDQNTALHELKAAGACIAWDKSYSAHQAGRDIDDCFKAGLRKGGQMR